MNNTLEQLKNYKNYRTVTLMPAVPDCVSIFAEIMGHGKDRVESIFVDDNNCLIEFSWMSCGYYSNKYYTVPLSVLTSDNPKNSITIWKLILAANETKANREEAESNLKDAIEKDNLAYNALCAEQWRQAKENRNNGG